MTTRTAALALLTGLALAASGPSTAATPAGSPAGVWLTPEDRGQVQLFDCGDRLCGRIVTSDQLRANPDLKDANNRNPALRDRPLKALTLIRDFSGGPRVWKGGSIYRPQDGGTYKGTLEMIDANTLKMTGCVAAPLCKTQVWKRVR